LTEAVTQGNEVEYTRVAESDEENEITSNHSEETVVPELRTSYGIKIIRTKNWIEGQEQSRSIKHMKALSGTEIQTIVAEQSLKKLGEVWETEEVLNEEPDTFLHKMDCPMSLTAIGGNTTYLHQEMAQPDRQEFIKAMAKEISTHEKFKHWVITPIKEVHSGWTILDSEWEMQRKKKIGQEK